MDIFLPLHIRLRELIDRKLSLTILLLVILILYVSDLLFTGFWGLFKLDETELIQSFIEFGGVDYAPEVWLGLLSLVLGTLIIVISIASQSTPKLIDLYISDKKSLLYIWFLTVGSAHNILLQIFFTSEESARHSSTILSTYLYLPLGITLAIPYILYILHYTKPNNVIEKIFKDNIYLISKISRLGKQENSYSRSVMRRYQIQMFESLNQLDDLLEYVSFKEPKGDIINNFSQSVQHYLKVKNKLPDCFFSISKEIRSDISFKTMSTQLEEIEKARVFYEQKAFRLIGNAYFKLIENNDFDLASMCVSEMSNCGKAATDVNDTALIDVLIVRFNTILRFGIKHGLKNSEVRNLYNALFHYSEFINYLVEKNQNAFIKKSCNYLKIYGTEVYKHSRQNPAFSFLVDVFAYELKKILIKLNETNYDKTFQYDILNLYLEMDNPPDVDRDDLGQWRIMNDGVRLLQIGLALFYLEKKEDELLLKIIHDIFEDRDILKEKFMFAVDSSCNKLRVFGPTFWEDTDRGNTNIYYSEYKEQIEPFMKIFNEEFLKMKD